MRDATTQAVIQNATVSIQGGSLQGTTNAQGQYTIANVPTGSRTVQAAATGYQSASQAVMVTASATATLDFQLTQAIVVAGDTYYVATTGNDANAGTETAPWRTIQHAADTVAPGDLVYIRGGTYNEAVRTQRSGSAGGYITFAAYTGETPIIDGTGVTTTGNGIIMEHSYIRFLGLEMTNWGDSAMWITNSSYFEIADCVIHDVVYGIGIAAGSHDFQLNRVEAHHFDLYGVDVSPSGGAPCYNGTFTDCVSHNGRDPQQNVDGFALGHGDQHDFTFTRCVTYEVFDGFDISSRNATLSRCSAHDCWNGGYKLWQDAVTLENCLGYNNVVVNVELDWDQSPGTATLRNCTLFDAVSFNILVENPNDSLHLYNCIVAGGDNTGLTFSEPGIANYRGDYNLFHNDNAARTIVDGFQDEFTSAQVSAGAWATHTGGQDAHSVAVTTTAGLFTDAAAYDLSLPAGSAAADAGTSTDAPGTDYAGTARPQGAGVDIGAYER